MVNRWESGQRPITIAILAMGGEGGGVLSDWIVALGEHNGFTAQGTSVAGVAQRTGATVYYVELYPPAAARDDNVRSEPILSLFPTPGQVDIVIASELMEAGRSIQRGFTTPDRTTLIASTNRVYSITEKIDLGDGRVDDESLLGSARASSRRLIADDFSRLASQAGSVISASLFGALAGANVLPFSRESFEDALRNSGKGVERSLAAFALGFDAAQLPELEPEPPKAGLGPVRLTLGLRPPKDPEVEAAEAAEKRHTELAVSDPRQLVGPQLSRQVDRVADFAESARSMVVHGCVRTAVYQSVAYTDLYLDRVSRVIEFESPQERGSTGSALLTTEVARHTALWMSYQDTIHVAYQKLRTRRMDGIRAEAHAESDQIVDVREYLHPQLDEITDTFPTALGKRLSRSRLFARMVEGATKNGMIINTSSVFGYSLLWVMAAMRPIRPRSLRYGREQLAIDAWLDHITRTAAQDYDLACEIAMTARVLKGYGQTHAHGHDSFVILSEIAPQLLGRDDAATTLARLTKAALVDEDGTALALAIAQLNLPVATAS